METELLKRCAKKRGLIVSCGGGTALREENVRIMKESGIVIWLTVLPETVRQRVETEGRQTSFEREKVPGGDWPIDGKTPEVL